MTQRYVFDFDAPPSAAPDELPQLLGGKGHNLAVMANDLGLPVPPGFTITTEACRAFLAGAWPAGLDDELREHMDRLGGRVGRQFADPADPLLVSVRSGAPVSMPGMMDTILNLGLTPDGVNGLAEVTGDTDFAADCLRRLGEGYRAVIGDEPVPDDPWAQLRAAIEAVFRSWNGDRAQAYRKREGIADDLGTAVTVQAMVFGNRGADSGTGVLFTRDPSTGEARPYGDLMFNAQGEDVVAGTHATDPLSVLDERLPAVADELRRHSGVLERHLRDVCDIEFTVEDGRLWLLQVRVGKRSPRAALRSAIEMAEDQSFPLSRAEAVERVAALLADAPREFVRSGIAPEPIARGLPASPGVASGAIVTSSAAAVAAAEVGDSVILVRAETSPEDVGGMARSAGVLTALGGVASHAAVVARGWGIPAVVGAASVRVGDDRVEFGERVMRTGERITIDGSSGEVFAGELAGEWQVAPEAATLLGWANDLGIPIAAGSEIPSPPAGVESVTGIGADDVLHVLLIRGAPTVEQLAEGLGVTVDTVQPLLDELGAAGLAEAGGGGFRLSAEGKLRALARIESDRDDVGVERAMALLDEFHAFDLRMKDVVTAWQLRDVGGEQALNDHTDAAYDTGVLDDLATLDSETGAWLAPLGDQLARFNVYRSRLRRALELARDGDQRFVASPRVDSYHGVWFELHEDLIRLAGQKRSS